MTAYRSLVLALLGLLLLVTPARAAYGPYETPVFLAMSVLMLAGLAAPVLWWRGRTAARQAADAMAALRRRFDALNHRLESWPDGGLRVDADGAVAFGALAAKLGAGEARVQPLASLLVPLSPNTRARLERAAAGGDESGRFLLHDEATASCHEVVVIGAGEARLLAFHDVTSLHERLTAAEARAERAEAAHGYLRDVADSVPIPLWRRDGAQRIDWCNAAYARVVGSSRDEVLRDGGIEIEAQIDAGEARRLARDVLTSGVAGRAERHFVVDDQRRNLATTETPCPAGAGTIGCAIDVTDRDELEVEHRRFVDATSEVLNNLNSAIAIFGADRRLVFHNRAYARLWHLDEDWLAGAPTHAQLLDEILERRLLPEQADYPAYKARVMGLYTNLLETTEEFEYLPDGRTLRSLVAPHPLGGLLIVHEDVTDRMRLERSYNTLIAVQRETLENLHESVAVFGADSRLKLHNSQFREMWRLDESDLESEPHVTDILASINEAYGRPSEWAEQFPRTAALIAERHALHVSVDRPDGSVVDFATQPLPDGNLLATYIDVTDRVRIERALRERNEALQTADRLKTEFIANMSYELRSPLNVILGFIEILDQEYFGELNEKQKTYCEGIIDSSHRLLALVNDILDLASVEAGQLELDLSEFDVEALLASVIDLTRENARARGIGLELDAAPDLGEITGDARRLRQVMMNLLSNAYQYSPQGSQVVVRARRTADGVTVTVGDEGIGIEAEQQNRVFERFERGDRGRGGYGAGLGLALVKSFVELHGGDVTLKSDVDQGTEVTVSLPLVPREDGPAEGLDVV